MQSSKILGLWPLFPPCCFCPHHGATLHRQVRRGRSHPAIVAHTRADQDPEYRRTLLDSGIPPPSSRFAFSNQSGQDKNAGYDQRPAKRARPPMDERPPQKHTRVAPPPFEPNFKTSTDFLECKKRVKVEDAILVGKATLGSDTWSLPEVSNQVRALRVR